MNRYGGNTMMIFSLYAGTLFSFFLGILVEHSFLTGLLYAGMFEVVFILLNLFDFYIQEKSNRCE